MFSRCQGVIGRRKVVLDTASTMPYLGPGRFSMFDAWVNSFLDVRLEVRINMDQWLGSMGFNLLINGIYWGHKPLILTFY